MPKARIYVTLKPTLLDAQGRVLQDALHALGYANVNQVRVGKYLEVELQEDGDLRQEVEEMCRKLLANPVIENYRFEVEP